LRLVSTSFSLGPRPHIVSIITPQRFEMLLPLACAWAAEQERTILQSGIALTESQLAGARQVGVVQPERVRLLRVPQIPGPAHPALAVAAGATNLITPLLVLSRSVMAFLFEQIVGSNALWLCTSLSIRHSMNGLVDSRVSCVRIYGSACPHRVIRMGQWSKRLSLRQRNCACKS
jgi:hypothetical protein